MKVEVQSLWSRERSSGIVFCLAVVLAFFFSSSCGFGGAGWDNEEDVAAARKYPSIESSRILVTTQEVPCQTLKQEFDTVFQDFQFRGEPVGESAETVKSQISGTPYSVAYEKFVLKVFRGNELIAERKLPRVFYMHPLSSAVMPGKSHADDKIICRTQSRATTGLHYILIVEGTGDILFEKVVSGGEDWDILPGESDELIIGGARTKTVVAMRD